ncbi:Nn.00g070680.m01.CDS01 [Neocucurbitaria sp. VM-36]
MSTPQAKRRRLNEAAKTLHKPFKSPFRTPLRPSIGSDPPSSDPLELHTPAPNVACAAVLTATGDVRPVITEPAPSEQPLATPITTEPCALKHAASRTKLSIHSRVVSKRTPSKPSLTRDIVQLRNEVQVLTQAQSLATSTKDDDLVILVDKWRAASRAAAEELFASTRDRVNRMGGVGAWKEREKESRDRQEKWNQEEMEAERERMEAAKENGEVSEEVYDRYAEMEDEKVDEEKETFKGADDDSFTMDMMLKTLNIDLKLIGYSKEAQVWEG